VSFGYDPAREVLQEINLEIASDQIIALVGGTGAGKSTLLSLVPRFYDPTRGRLTLDGRDLREITKKSLRAQIAIVLQDSLLFSTSVRENIAYGRADATDDEVREAACRAQADQFILQLPHGYESLVGEREVISASGQRQRIGIARAFFEKTRPFFFSMTYFGARSCHRSSHHGNNQGIDARSYHSHCHASHRHHSLRGPDHRARP